jgi:hypothetical protein
MSGAHFVLPPDFTPAGGHMKMTTAYRRGVKIEVRLAKCLAALEWTAQFEFVNWLRVPLLACPAVPTKLLDKPAVAPRAGALDLQDRS